MTAPAASGDRPYAVTGTEVVAIARVWIGTPYRHQASLQGAGCDCLGLIRGVWRTLHGEESEIVPAYAPDWAEAGGGEALRDAARRHLDKCPLAELAPGDVLLFRWRDGLAAKHAAILATPSSFIHAYDGSAVVETPLAPWWRRRIAYVFRFPLDRPE